MFTAEIIGVAVRRRLNEILDEVFAGEEERPATAPVTSKDVEDALITPMPSSQRRELSALHDVLRRGPATTPDGLSIKGLPVTISPCTYGFALGAAAPSEELLQGVFSQAIPDSTAFTTLLGTVLLHSSYYPSTLQGIARDAKRLAETAPAPTPQRPSKRSLR